MKLGQKKLRIHVTPTLSTNADSSTDIRKSPLFDTFIHFYGPCSPFLLLQFLNNFFYKKKLSRVIYHASHVTNDNSHSHRPYTPNSPFILQ